ncbi:WxcM-like domain-containing protein [Candidatus Microgenomates bacterium]|nr:WxcM-like domain-containing protein [Candidatus Microgenomates bacterium]
MDVSITKVKTIKDTRGKLVVFLKESELDDAKKKFGQIYFVVFSKKGDVRGNHYHKKWHEWFGIISGRVRVVLEDVRSGERQECILSANRGYYTRLETGPYIAHAIQSLTNTASLLSYTDTEWTDNSDTYERKLI